MNTQKAYSLVTFEKSVDEDQRIIRGIASTPTPDRSNDIVEPKGAKFKLPIPLLSQHDHTKPIGHVIEAKITSKGIEIVAQIAKGIDYVDQSWAQIKAGLIRGLSIGFRPLEYQEHKNSDGYGYTFSSWEWYELSAVTVPANADASISMVKSLASSGRNDLNVKNSPRDFGEKIVKLTPKENKVKTFAEQIKSFEERKTELQTTANEILQKSAQEGRTLDATESESYDQAVAEIAAVEKHIERLQSAEKTSIATAKPVAGDTVKAADASRAGVITVRDNLAPGIEFSRFAKCVALSKGNLLQAEQIAKAQYPENHRIQNVIKAAVAAGTTSGTTWAAPLVEYNTITSDFIEFLRPKTVIGRFGNGGIPALRNIPFRVRIAGQTSGGASYWTGEGAGKGLMKADFNTVEFGYAKVAAISVLTDELLRFSSPSAEMLVRDTMVAALVERLDADFINPAKAAVAGVSPASITNGVTAVTASGTDIDAAKADIKTLFGKFITAKLSLSSGVWIMHPAMALSLSMMQNALGQPEFAGITMMGGTLMGLPVITTEHVASGTIVIAAANEIYIAQDGVSIDASREASLEMSDAPTGNANTPTGASLVSLWQTNSVALRVEQAINWQKRRTDAVQLITGAAYTG